VSELGSVRPIHYARAMPHRGAGKGDTMTRKDFALIAGVIAERRNQEQKMGAEGEMLNLVNAILDSLSQDFATELATTNANFDRSRFLNASGVQN
jgi:hypothetical protein